MIAFASTPVVSRSDLVGAKLNRRGFKNIRHISGSCDFKANMQVCLGNNALWRLSHLVMTSFRWSITCCASQKWLCVALSLTVKNIRKFRV